MLLTLVIVMGAIFFLWLVGLTIWFYLVRSRQQRLAWGKEMVGLEKILEELEARMGKLGEEEKETRDRLEGQIERARRFLRGPGVVRYNPFPETGGDHSFSVAFIDSRGDGVMMTGLHAREGTRVYVKPVKGGKTEYKLSREEERSLREALKG